MDLFETWWILINWTVLSKYVTTLLLPTSHLFTCNWFGYTLVLTSFNSLCQNSINSANSFFSFVMVTVSRLDIWTNAFNRTYWRYMHKYTVRWSFMSKGYFLACHMLSVCAYMFIISLVGILIVMHTTHACINAHVVYLRLQMTIALIC